MVLRGRCRVITDYTSTYSNPVVVSAWETVTVHERKSEWPGWLWCTSVDEINGWVPKRILKRQGSDARVREDYNATELSVSTGTVLTFNREESGWLWCTNPRGESGWVPRKNVEIIEFHLP